MDSLVPGHTLTINDQPCLVTGIMPRDFSFYPKQTQLWTLIPPDGEYARNPWISSVGVVALLKPCVTRASAEAELAALQRRIIGESPIRILSKAEPDVLACKTILFGLQDAICARAWSSCSQR